MPCRHLFAYGTLMDPDLIRAVMGRHPRGIPAWLSGFQRVAVRGQRYPALIRAHRGWVGGWLYRDIKPGEWRQLNRYEGTEYRRERVVVARLDGRHSSAWVYVWHASHRRLQRHRPWLPLLAIRRLMLAHRRPQPAL